MKLIGDCRLSVRPRMKAGFCLLGSHPPVNEPAMQRMSRPLLKAPYELLPPPSAVELMDRPLLPASPPRSAMHMQSPGGFHREPSPPRFVPVLPGLQFSRPSGRFLNLVAVFWAGF